MPVTISRLHRAVLLNLLGMFFSFGAPVAAQQNSSLFGTLSDRIPVPEEILRPGLRELSSAERPARAKRDRGKGALYGAAIGALVGGVGFAAVNYAFTTTSPRDEYNLSSVVLGAGACGVVGAIVGAIIGVPERDENQTRQVQLHISPDLARGGVIDVSLALPSR